MNGLDTVIDFGTGCIPIGTATDLATLYCPTKQTKKHINVSIKLLMVFDDECQLSSIFV